MEYVYPVNNYEPLMPGLVIAGVAIFHVFLAQFAVGGGFLLCYFQWLAMTGRSTAARTFVNGYFKVLVLVSFVVGALTGVGIWFTTIQVSPATIGEMVHEFHWLWATEWAFFCLEIVAGYCFYRYQKRLNDRAALGLLALYAFAAWMSLFWINGILSWQLTPGKWIETQRTFDGFFNPSFWPSLLFRTIVCLTLASLAACVVINFIPQLSRDERKSLIARAAHFMMPMVLMPALGIWFVGSMPEDSRGWVLGGSPAMMLFFMISVGASVAIGAYAILGMWLQELYINGATALLLLFLAFGATSGGEFVREGARKPFSIRGRLYSNSIRPGDVARLRREGVLKDDTYPVRHEANAPEGPVLVGAKVYRRNCSACHTMEGANSIADLTATWDLDQMRLNIAKLQHTKPFMPPFAGTAQELESLVHYIRWVHEGRPGTWTEPLEGDAIESIERWLVEAGDGRAADRRIGAEVEFGNPEKKGDETKAPAQKGGE
jgi:cytochrome d ubiquinol oxidase subunit I